MWNTPSTERLRRIPKLYETEETPLEDKLIHLHLFLGGNDWYIAEFDGGDLFWGFACLNGDLECAEWGYISFAELKALSIGPLEIDCELEEFWKVRPAKEVDLIAKAMKCRKEAPDDKRSAEELRAIREFEEGFKGSQGA
jgi:hypothetical protein